MYEYERANIVSLAVARCVVWRRLDGPAAGLPVSRRAVQINVVVLPCNRQFSLLLKVRVTVTMTPPLRLPWVAASPFYYCLASGGGWNQGEVCSTYEEE
jgi:hypothetical protein